MPNLTWTYASLLDALQKWPVNSSAAYQAQLPTIIGLGERRAQTVRRALMLQGAAETQITTVSFGAERPAAEGDDEAAWAQNRRVELVKW